MMPRWQRPRVPDGHPSTLGESRWTVSVLTPSPRLGPRAGSSRRTILRLLAGFTLDVGLAGFDRTEANKKKKGKGKAKKKPVECPGIRKRCGEACISFLSCCHNGKPGCPPCHLCVNGTTCEQKERPTCEPCKEAVCNDDAFECVNKPKPDCNFCQHVACKDGAYRCVETEGLTPCSPGLCCNPNEPYNEVCCDNPVVSGGKACVRPDPACDNAECRYRCSGSDVCCGTDQKCCSVGSGDTVCVPWSSQCP